MAAEETRVPAAPEPLKMTEAKMDIATDGLKEAHGDGGANCNGQAQHPDAKDPAEESKPVEETKGREVSRDASAELKVSGAIQPDEKTYVSGEAAPMQQSQPSNSAAEHREDTVGEKAGSIEIGDKREHNQLAPGNEDKFTAPEISEPVVKKQKTNDASAQGNENQSQSTAPTTNGAKKKAGRPKKIKDAVKKVIPTDGIGSRTRSRTKTSSD